MDSTVIETSMTSTAFSARRHRHLRCAGSRGGTDNYQAQFPLSRIPPVGPRLDWLAGLFYTHEDNPGVETFLAKQVVSGATGRHAGHVQ